MEKFYWLNNYIRWKNGLTSNPVVNTIGLAIAANHLMKSINKN